MPPAFTVRESQRSPRGDVRFLTNLSHWRTKMSFLLDSFDRGAPPFARTARVRGGALLFVACLVATGAHAATVTDPADDFVPTFAGAHSGDLDVLSVSATFDGITFEIGATVNAPVGTLPS